MRGLAFARTSMEGVSGITPNKMYMSTKWETTGNEMYIMNDDGFEIFILEHGCAFLGGKDWEFIRPSELGELL
jgi:hypothetical protein